jgi:hypothetical protein
VYAPRPNPPTPAAPLRRALPALRRLGLAVRVVRAWALVGLVPLLWAGGVDVRAAPAIPATLDVGAGRIAITAPITGQYIIVCQEAAGPTLRGPWALEAGDQASMPMHAMGVPCWAQASETREGELMSIWETPRFTVWRAWLPEVRR